MTLEGPSENSTNLVQSEEIRPPRTTPRIPNEPTGTLGFELNPTDEFWAFAPFYYPDRFVQTKGRKLNRDGKQDDGENVELKNLKNREFHASGVVLASEVTILQRVLDHSGQVEIITPLTPSGGMQCEIKNSELGEKSGFDSIERQWLFKYSFDLVSTGLDENSSGRNAIVSEILNSSSATRGSSPSQ